MDIEKQLASARQRLLDLTMRNRLLNFRPNLARARTAIQITNQTPTGIYAILVAQEKATGFRGQQAHVGEALEEEIKPGFDPGGRELVEGILSTPVEVPPGDRISENQHYERVLLQTSLQEETLQKRILNIYQESQSMLEELGYSTLYLAAGFLKWTESPESHQDRLAPLVLIPVDIERAGVRSTFKLQWTSEEIATNVSLQAMLAEQGISIPAFEMPEDETGVREYLRKVAKAVKAKPGWQVTDDIYLGFFSFAKFIMYKDLDPKAWPEGKSPADQKLIQVVFGDSVEAASSEGFHEEEVDEKLSFRDLFHVLDADPSQIAVIEDLKAGRNLVVEGPPGTGKSQTIVNAIAELLAAGKSVLFVSEKNAALEVVKTRLDKVGLGGFCLELHSRKATKKAFLKTIEDAISGHPTKQVSLDQQFDQLDLVKSELNAYSRALRDPVGQIQFSPYRCFCEKERSRRYFADLNQDIQRIKLRSPDEADRKGYDEAIHKLGELKLSLESVVPLASNPWCCSEPGLILPTQEDSVKAAVNECLNKAKTLQAAIVRIVGLAGVNPPANFLDLGKTVVAARVIAVSQPTDHAVLINLEWNQPSSRAETVINKVAIFKETYSSIASKFGPEALSLSLEFLEPVVDEFTRHAGRFLRFLSGSYRRLKCQLCSFYARKAKRPDEGIVLDFKQLVHYLALRKELRSLEETGKALFGSCWLGERSDAKTLTDFAKWIVSFRQQLLSEALTHRAVEVVVHGVSAREVEEAAKELSVDAEQFRSILTNLATMLNIQWNKAFGMDLDRVGFAELNQRLLLWQADISKLQHWSQYVACRKACLDTIAGPMVDSVESGAVAPEAIIPCFKGNFADELLNLAFSTRPALASFVGVLHEDKIKHFRELESKLILQNRGRLLRKLCESRPNLSSGASPGSEAGIILGELGRKRGGMTIRKMMSLAGGLVQRIKPCFMMSPLSIAQFLDPRTVRFDVIIFDEASQVRPEDALGAFLRGTQVAVMGDTKQLPPTSFFDHLMESDDWEDELEIPVGDVESILHLCRRCFPAKSLRWHYRSRHESLIAVSNQEFYDNHLLLYPSPVHKSDNLGLHLIHLPDTVYDRGRSSVNWEEARRIVRDVLEHYRKFPNKSAGIGAFNIRQQNAIQDELERQLKIDPELERFFRHDWPEYCFVKNLETIQGDERDIIFISVAFGFDKDRKLSLSFGPVNNEGGERRLNVLFTRARETCYVYANFKAKDMPLAAGAPRGIEVLKRLLDYAETGNLGSSGVPMGDTESAFEDLVYDFLVSHGHNVHKQVGCAGFRVDLAIVDPKAPGQYLLGIECDGAKYHNSAVARDRDRLRQQILENLGWRICRIWSTDWYRNHKDASSRLLNVIEQVKAKPTHPPVIGPNPRADSEDAGSDTIEPEPDPRNGHPIPEYSEYKVCDSLGCKPFGELHEFPPEKLAPAVANIVDVEGPVHFDEVVRRIRTLWGLNRAGSRIYQNVSSAADIAIRSKLIRRKGEFLWPGTERPLVARQRNGNPPPNIDLVCDEEIASAVERVIRRQFATMADDLVIQSSRLLGVKATSETTARRITGIINRLLMSQKLQKLPNGMIDLGSL